MAALHVLIDRVGDKEPAADWAVHPWFGPCLVGSGGCSVGNTSDYHLRQFGV